MRELNSKLSFPYLLSCKTMRLNLNLNFTLLNFNRKERHEIKGKEFKDILAFKMDKIKIAPKKYKNSPFVFSPKKYKNPAQKMQKRQILAK